MAKKEKLSPEVENMISPEAEGVSEEPTKEEVKEEKAENVAESAPVSDGKADCVVPPYVFGDGDYVTVGLNGVNYQIEVGVPVRVPKGVKAILDESIRRKKEAKAKTKAKTTA